MRRNVAAVIARRNVAAVIAPVGVAAVLWGRLLWGAPAWRDEGATLLFASLSPGQLWAATAHTDRSMIPYYLLVEPLARLGDPLFAIRALSFLGFLTAVGAVAALCARMWGSFAGFVAGVFLATHVPTAALGLQARSYPLFLASFALATLILTIQSEARDGGRKSRWVLYAGLVTFGVAMNVLAATAFVAHFLFLMLRPARRAFVWRGLASMSIGALAGVVLVWISRGQTAQLSWVSFSARSVLGVPIHVLFGKGWEVLLSIGLWSLASVSILAKVVTGRAREIEKGAWLGALIALTSLILLVAISAAFFPALVSRYATSGTVGAAIWISAGVAAVASSETRPVRWFQFAAIGMLLALVPVAALARNIQYRDGSAKAAGIVRGSAVPGDYVVSIQPVASSGITGALALALKDDGMWHQAVAKLFDDPAGPTVSKVDSVAPWSTHPVSGLAHSGRIYVVNFGEAQKLLPGCTTMWARQGVTLVDCP